MPKELIHSKYGPEIEGQPESVLHIGWTRDHEHVEAAVLMPDGRPLKPSTPEGNGWFVQLDRAGINRAIRALRAARDQAYGRDE